MSCEIMNSKKNTNLCYDEYLCSFVVRRTLKGGIVDEDGNSLNEAILEHTAQANLTRAASHDPPRSNGHQPASNRPLRAGLSVSARYKHIAT